MFDPVSVSYKLDSCNTHTHKHTTSIHKTGKRNRRHSMSVPCNYIEQRSVWHQITNQSESKNERTLASTWCHQAANIHMALVQDFYANKICTITAHIHITWWQVKKKKLQDIYLTAEKVRGRERKRQRFRIHVKRRSVGDLCRSPHIPMHMKTTVVWLLAPFLHGISHEKNMQMAR